MKTPNFKYKMWIVQAEASRCENNVYTYKLVHFKCTLHTYSSVDSTMFTYQPLCLPLPQYCKSTKKRSNKYANFTVFSISFICFVHLFHRIHRKMLFSFSPLALFCDCSLARSSAVGFISFIILQYVYENRYVITLVLNIFFVFISSGWMLVSVPNNDDDNDVSFKT